MSHSTKRKRGRVRQVDDIYGPWWVSFEAMLSEEQCDRIGLSEDRGATLCITRLCNALNEAEDRLLAHGLEVPDVIRDVQRMGSGAPTPPSEEPRIKCRVRDCTDTVKVTSFRGGYCYTHSQEYPPTTEGSAATPEHRQAAADVLSDHAAVLKAQRGNREPDTTISDQEWMDRRLDSYDSE